MFPPTPRFHNKNLNADFMPTRELYSLEEMPLFIQIEPNHPVFPLLECPANRRAEYRTDEREAECAAFECLSLTKGNGEVVQGLFIPEKPQLYLSWPVSAVLFPYR